MNIWKKISTLAASLALFFLSMGNSANAQWDKGFENAGKFGLPGATAGSVVSNIAYWLLGIFAFFGVMGFIISGIMYLASTGNEEMVGNAKKYMTYSMIGVVVGLSGYVIIQAVSMMLDARSF